MDREPQTIRELLPAGVATGRTDLLVTGRGPESMRGVFRGLVGPVADGDHGVAVVSTRAPPSIVANRYGLGEVGDADGRLSVVDARPGGAGVDADSDGLLWTVPSPFDLHESSIALGECLEALGRNGASPRHVVFDSLTTVLRSVDVDRVSRFAYEVGLGTDGREGLALFPVYTPSTDSRAIERLLTVVDALVEVRVTGSETQVRTRGFRGAPDGWVPLADRPVPRGRAD
jgi:hypothetical protein